MTQRLGLVALGDSITYAEGNMLAGVPYRSWALWLAEALDLPFTCRAVCGETAAGVLARQVPALDGRAYDVGTLHVGANDIRALDFALGPFEEAVGAVLSSLAAVCSRVVVVTVPLDLGRPRAGAKVGDANAAIRRRAAETGATVVSLDDLRGWLMLIPDAVHPTALGQVEIADRAARALGAPLPSETLVDARVGPRGRAAYARTHAAMQVRDWRHQLVQRARMRLGS